MRGNKMKNLNMRHNRQSDYKRNSIIKILRNGEIVKVTVLAKSTDIKDGRAGFDGFLTDDKNEKMVWGYDAQITEIVSK